MTDSEFEQVRSFLAQTYGLDMNSKRTLLECRLARERDRLQLPSFSAYFDLVESGRNQQERNRFVNLVTTHYTYFLRESAQFKFLFATAFPELLAKRPNRPWNILCAGCSTGEECYSVSMLVEDYARTHPIPSVRITGIDLSQPAIEEARTAAYPESRINRVPVAGAMRTSFGTVSCTPLPSASARASFWRRATSATTKSCAGRTTSSCAETSSSTSKPKFATG